MTKYLFMMSLSVLTFSTQSFATAMNCQLKKDQLNKGAPATITVDAQTFKVDGEQCLQAPKDILKHIQESEPGVVEVLSCGPEEDSDDYLIYGNKKVLVNFQFEYQCSNSKKNK